MLDRIWLTLIVLAMLVWAVVMVDRLGVWYVLAFIALAFLVRAFSKPQPPQPPTRPPTPAGHE